MISAPQIDSSPAFRKWCDAFRLVAGLDVHLLDPTRLDDDLQEGASGYELCRLLCQHCKRCHFDRQRFATRLKIADTYHAGPFAMRCGAGLTVTALPLRLADGTTVFLSTGPMLVAPDGCASPRRQLVKRVQKLIGSFPVTELNRMAAEISIRDLRRFKAAITLLRLLTEHLSHISRQMLAVPQTSWNDCLPLRRACEMIENQFTDDLHLDEIARQIGVSRSYLSHEFRRRMGLTFTEFLAERRVFEVKCLLGDPAMRIIDALLAAGFQSVSQGNRVFRAASGMSPSDYRASVSC